MTAARFDELIHRSSRLALVALLAGTDWVEFAFLRDQLGLSDSALSKQLSTLEEAEYVLTERPVRDHRRHVRVRLTAAGTKAFDGHVAALREIVENADRTRNSRGQDSSRVRSSGGLSAIQGRRPGNRANVAREAREGS
jgi:DNA-binding transcriptional ArsR family regulator